MKHVRAIFATSLGIALAAGSALSCGYRPVLDAPEPELRLSVVAAPHRAPSPAALQAALAGARSELSRAGVLRAGSGHPRLVLEVLRVDELGAGLTAPGDLPLARGSTVAVAGRAWVEEKPGQEPARDTGDMRRAEPITAGASPAGDALLHAEAVRAAAGELGRALARRVLGDPVPADEAL